MDWLRSCYSSYQRLYRDRPDVLTLGRWHWCPAGAKPVPYPTVFGSRNWDWLPDLDDLALGEVKRPRPYSKGQANPRLTGQRVCGSAEVWLHGALYSQRGTPAVDEDGVPLCCLADPLPPGGATCAGDATWVISDLDCPPLLLDDGGDLLLDDGGHLCLDDLDCPPLLLDDGGDLLLDDGGHLCLEA